MNGFKFNNEVATEGPIKARDVLVSEPKVLETINNRIYFYSEIDRSSMLTLNRNLRELSGRFISEAITTDTKEPISLYLHINSYGGSIFAGLAGMDEIIKTCEKVNITTIIDGCCASAATFLSIVGKHRLINRHAYMLIHQLSSCAWGKYEELKDNIQNMDKLMEMIKNLYKTYTKIPEEKLDEMLKHDLWFDAEECLKYGLVDEII
jgi:ATP-dependent protease ClpP protease subunit